MDENKSLSTVRELANELGLPVAWLKDEAQAGRIPCLRIGKRLVFNAEAVERTLVERAGESIHEGPRS